MTDPRHYACDDCATHWKSAIDTCWMCGNPGREAYPLSLGGSYIYQFTGKEEAIT